jgi:hypothetical protein
MIGLRSIRLKFGQAAVAAVPEAAARDGEVPLQVPDIELPRTTTFYGGGLVLSRPDQHLVWRGAMLPTDTLALIGHVLGAAS